MSRLEDGLAAGAVVVLTGGLFPIITDFPNKKALGKSLVRRITKGLETPGPGNFSRHRDRLAPMSSPLNIVVYSHDLTVRNHIVSALGRQVASDLPEHNIIEIATGAAVRLYVDSKKPVDLFILDGESHPEGGMGIARELKDEVFNCPPVLLIAGRVQDSWLATWSRADGVILHPIDPFTIADKAAELLRTRPVAVR